MQILYWSSVSVRIFYKVTWTHFIFKREW